MTDQLCKLINPKFSTLAQVNSLLTMSLVVVQRVNIDEELACKLVQLILNLCFDKNLDLMLKEAASIVLVNLSLNDVCVKELIA